MGGFSSAGPVELVQRDRLSLGFLSSWISLKPLGAALVPDLCAAGGRTQEKLFLCQAASCYAK